MDASFRNQLEDNLMSLDNRAETANTISSSMNKIENALMKSLISGESATYNARQLRELGFSNEQITDMFKKAKEESPSEEVKSVAVSTQALEYMYQRAQRAYVSFQTLMKNMHETLMSAIRNLSVR